MNQQWPSFPYKGLSYYGPEDVLLFAARDEDKKRIATSLSKMDTKILVLHGRTGCGKSSFLRAGLIPFLETPKYGFQFLKEDSTDNAEKAQNKTLFVRSTDDPLARIAEEIFDFCQAPYVLDTPVGQQEIDLRIVLGSCGKNREEFAEKTSRNPLEFVKIIQKLADMLPKTLVIIIDQAEEVLTLLRGPESEKSKERFFKYLSVFCTTKLDLKILISIRTEFYGEFVNEIYGSSRIADRIRQEVLKELNIQQIATAIKRPTENKNYRFEYDDGVPAKIAAALHSSPHRGGILPVMQIVCGRLYMLVRERAKDGEIKKIIWNDYTNLGDISTQVDWHVRAVLRELCESAGLSEETDIDKEVDNWYEVLWELVRVQVDGTVTTEQRTEGDLRDEAQRNTCKIKFSLASKFLSDEKNRILQPVEVFNVETKKINMCYSLGHDSIGLALNYWRANKEAMESLRAWVEQKTVAQRRHTSRFKLVSMLSVGSTISASAIAISFAISNSKEFDNLEPLMGLFVVVYLIGVFGVMSLGRSFLKQAIKWFRKF